MPEWGELDPLTQLEENRLANHLSTIERSYTASEEALRGLLGSPKRKHAVDMVLVEHAHNLGRLLDYLFEPSSGYEVPEAASITAGVLVADDEKRVDFLRGITGEDAGTRFYEAYPKQEKLAEDIVDLYQGLVDEPDDPNDIADFVSTLMEEHVGFIETDIVTFQETAAFRESFKWAERRSTLKERFTTFVLITGGVAVGTVIGNRFK